MGDSGEYIRVSTREVVAKIKTWVWLENMKYHRSLTKFTMTLVYALPKSQRTLKNSSFTILSMDKVLTRR